MGSITDIYVVFIEQGLKLLNNVGQLGYICPHKFFNSDYGEPVRSVIAEGSHLSQLVHFGAQQVFEGATTYTCLLFLSKAAIQISQIVQVDDLDAWRITGAAKEGPIDNSQLNGTKWNFAIGSDSSLFAKLSAEPNRLRSVASRIFQGFKTGADPVFILKSLGKDIYFSKGLNCQVHLEPCYLRPLFKSGQLKRYYLHPAERVIIFPYSNGALVTWKEIETNAPMTANYLSACKHILDSRESGRWAGPTWFCFSRSQALEVMGTIKILTADLELYLNVVDL